MKRMLYVAVLLLASAFSLAVPAELPAADYSVGMYGFYAWWNPLFRNELDDFEMDPLLLWGPIVSVRCFDKWSFTLVIAQNTTNPSSASYSQYVDTGTLPNGPFVLKTETKFFRIDVDFSVTYALTNTVRLFGGIKLYKMNQTQNDTSNDVAPATYMTQDGLDGVSLHSESNFSPGAGVTTIIPLARGTSMALSASLVYVKMNFGLPVPFSDPAGNINTDDSNSISGTYNGLGTNLTSAISYYVEPLGVSLSLGGRFQAIKYFGGGSEDMPELANDYYYGVTMSVLYNF